MQMNQVLKPRVATPGLIVASAVTVALTLILAALALTVAGTAWLLMTIAALNVVLVIVWGRRLHDLRRWQSETDAQWKRLAGLKGGSGTTTEITVLTVDAPQPTGAWVTIRWNRFDYIQPAWIEALPEPIWPGSVLLIRPDPAQVRPGAPWPEAYRISGDHVLAWAPHV
ncbi:hypothetical protein RI444_08585 [Paenarthrobacter sp. AT5]|uniref:hypothetical protein n=1 Tax=Paenarthrobacter TaxID=1742992 RepID=UPI001A997D23|nr:MULTISPECIES: hypothetical protein [Paenarthrobacter]QSZ54331.1 hypothetical protein AYX19_15985 [Paenarthrobacter ureafaciens]WOC62655.1 hypothetical protein RI444_08585 [Paenarthrobacter sp. AT5]